jgi:hypothetical protein
MDSFPSYLRFQLCIQKQCISEIHGTTSGACSVVCVNVGPLTLRCRAMAHLKIEAPSAVYGTILKVFCMLGQ